MLFPWSAKVRKKAIFAVCARYCFSSRRELAPAGGWVVQATALKGDCTDAHNTISLGLDGAGHLHISWAQRVGQGNGEKTVDLPPQPVRILEMDHLY